MNGSTAYIIVAILIVGVGLGAAIIPSLRDLRREVMGLVNRVGKIEGKVEVLSSAVLRPEKGGRPEDG